MRYKVYCIRFNGASEDLGPNTVWNPLGESMLGNKTTNTMFDPIGAPHNVYKVISIQ